MRDIGLVKAELKDCMQDICTNLREKASEYITYSDLMEKSIPEIDGVDVDAKMLSEQLIRNQTQRSLLEMQLAELHMKYLRLLAEYVHCGG